MDISHLSYTLRGMIDEFLAAHGLRVADMRYLGNQALTFEFSGKAAPQSLPELQRGISHILAWAEQVDENATEPLTFKVSVTRGRVMIVGDDLIDSFGHMESIVPRGYDYGY